MQLALLICDQSDISWLENFLDFSDLQQLSGAEILPEHDTCLVLKWDADGLSLHAPGHGNAGATRVNFESARLRHRVETTRKHEGLLKAVGMDKLKQGQPWHVVDATAGLGIDAFTLAAKGCQVTLLEKNPVMAALLHDGFRRGSNSADPAVRDILARMTLCHADTHDYFAQPGATCPDVIYLDPMFPPRRKSARVKKDIALMQSLLPPNEDVAELLALARGLAGRRVVLKQPGKAGKADRAKADFLVPGKACHFEVFLTHNLEQVSS